MKLIATLISLLAVSVSAIAAEPPEYGRYSLRLPAQLINLAVEDLDGDGLGDIVAFSVRTGKGRQPARMFSVFYQKNGRGFSPDPDQTWQLDPGAVVFDVGRVSQGAKKAICYLAPDGLYSYLPNGRQFTGPARLISSETIFSQPDMLDLPRWPFIVEPSGKGPGFLLMPTIKNLRVYLSNGGGYRQVNALPLSTRTTFSLGPGLSQSAPLTISHRIPAVTATGFNTPAARDLFATWDDDADVWLEKPGGGYMDQPGLSFRPGLLDKSKREEGSFDSASVQAVDLNGDGLSDLVVTKTAGGVAQTKSLVFIYMRRRDGSFAGKPDQSIITEGVVGPRIIDVNGDGRQDILLPSVKMGITNFINMLTSKQVNMDIAIYLQDGRGRYPEQPTKVKAVSFKLDVSNLGKSARPVMGMGRFSRSPGYGLAVVSKEDRVSVYLPDRYSIFTDSPGIKLNVDAPTEMEVTDLNGDGLDDLVLTYRKDKDNNRTVNVFISK